jgi:hypothetical protein
MDFPLTPILGLHVRIRGTMFYNHKNPNKLSSTTYSIQLYVSKVIFAPLAGLEIRVSQIFMMFTPNYSFVLCSDVTYTRHVKLIGACGSRNLTLGCTNCYIYVKELFSIRWGCLGGIWTEGGFTLVLLQGWGGGSEVLLEEVQF